jgi:hypothetical protein
MSDKKEGRATVRGRDNTTQAGTQLDGGPRLGDRPSPDFLCFGASCSLTLHMLKAPDLSRFGKILKVGEHASPHLEPRTVNREP